jgi:hypothetical protein
MTQKCLSTIGVSSLFVAALLALVACSVRAQNGKHQGSKVDTRTLIKQLESPDVGLITVNTIAHLYLTEATPVLKEKFSTSSDPTMKAATASALIQLGAQEPVYWDFVYNQAKPAIYTDAPFPLVFDSTGTVRKKELLPAFVAWAQLHQLPPVDASWQQVYDYPGRLTWLAVTGDPRALAPLRLTLNSPNYYLQWVSARGLAKLHDSSSIPLIIRDCAAAPSSMGSLIARALLYFDDDRASAAAAKYILDRQLLDDLRRQSSKKDADPFWP